MRIAIILIILFIGLAFVGGCTDLEADEEDDDMTIGGAVIKQMADTAEELNPPYSNNESS